MPDLIPNEDQLDIDLRQIVLKAKEAYGWSDQDAKTAHAWYVRHLCLIRKFPNQPHAAISKRADELWHMHILDTKKYAEDCERLFGRFVHHQPIYGEPSKLDAKIHSATKSLYETEFGSVPSDLAANSFNPYWS